MIHHSLRGLSFALVGLVWLFPGTGSTALPAWSQAEASTERSTLSEETREAARVISETWIEASWAARQ